MQRQFNFSRAAAVGLLVLVTGCTVQPPPTAMAPAAAPVSSVIAADALPRRLDLVGMNAHQLDAMFGTPEMVMNAGPAQWWRFHLDGCAIEVFLITTEKGMVVRHAAVERQLDAGPALAPACTELDPQRARQAPEAQLASVSKEF
ncbi:MAG TPA: hypothetical protein VNS22_02300 [Geminicoccus sp.]|uniref:hypothetical protein n=1 Tax=Geminicoccus sp. TaxID=2024832 RepID=UPI002B5BD999|nr:hypothetical protein [Geminicoccus sp.]HWL67195.1 hypothetical protein [Geminicoccus sp.]